MTKKPHLVFDARLYGPQHTGIGRYIKNLLQELPSSGIFDFFRVTLITDQKTTPEIKKNLGSKFNYFPVNIPHYSLKEQFLFPFILAKLKPDLTHFPHFNRPFFWTGQSVVTLHDLIKHQSKGSDTTTRSPAIYWLKFLAYKALTGKIIKKNHLIVPSSYWKDFLVKKYRKNHQEITVTHEAVDPEFQKLCQKTKTIPKKYDIKKPYLVYTGNLYPHKNIDLLLKAMKEMPGIYLYICSKKNNFWQRAKEKAVTLKIQKQVRFLNFPSDQTVVALYKSALALVHPSKIEGFGLTGLEAMNCSCPVISANSSCLPEIYGPAALYFDPNDHHQLVDHVQTLLDSPKKRNRLIVSGKKQVKKYSWTKTAQKTITVYQKLLKI